MGKCILLNTTMLYVIFIYPKGILWFVKMPIFEFLVAPERNRKKGG